MFFSKKKFIKKAINDGCVAEGICVDSKLRLGNDDSGNGSFKNDTQIVKYEYIVNGNKYYKKVKFQSPGCVSAKFPYRVKIYYSKGNPRKSICNEESNKLRFFPFVIAIILLIIIVNSIL